MYNQIKNMLKAVYILKRDKKSFYHIFLLIFWPIYLSFFFFIERFANLSFYPVECRLDHLIPFCEYFIIPYVLWYLYLFWIHLYTLIHDVASFKKLMYFLIMSFFIACIFFVSYPTEQLLRPETFERDNIFTNAVKFLYTIDTNTNVCPSLHVGGSLAVLLTAWNAKGLNTAFWRILNIFFTLIITASTVFLKQHSLIDTLAALVLCAIVYPLAFILPDKLANYKRISGKKTVKKAEIST